MINGQIREDELGFHEFLDKFNKSTHFELNDELHSKDFNSYREMFYHLKKLIFTDYKKQLDLFYFLLNEYGYNLKYDVIDAIKDIYRATSYDDIFELMQLHESSVIIDQISYDNGLIRISSKDQLYEVGKANDVNVNELIAFEASVSSPFQASANKTLFKDKNGMIYDLENGIKMNEETFNSLYEPSYELYKFDGKRRLYSRI